MRLQNILKKTISTYIGETSYKNKLSHLHKKLENVTNVKNNKIKITSYKNQVENNNVSNTNTNKETRKNITSFKDKLNKARMDDYDEYYTNRIIKNGGL